MGVDDRRGTGGNATTDADEEKEEIPVCENCESASVNKKTGPEDARENEEDWYCRNCATHFNEPEYRVRDRDPNTNALAPKMRQALGFGADQDGGGDGGE